MLEIIIITMFLYFFLFHIKEDHRFVYSLVCLFIYLSIHLSILHSFIYFQGDLRWYFVYKYK